MWVPGIDLCNHTLSANADIRQARGGHACMARRVGGRAGRGVDAWMDTLTASQPGRQHNACWRCRRLEPLIDRPSARPIASCRCVHSPGCCQGADALDDLCPPETAAAARQEPSRFELVAGDTGITAEEEVTISYGSWPSDVFLLFFGFAPDNNPNDSSEWLGWKRGSCGWLVDGWWMVGGALPCEEPEMQLHCI